MVRRAFFSFHYQNDIWRVNQVRNSWVLQPGIQKAVWYDASLWEQTKLKGNAALMQLIDDGLNNTSVTVVLIGKETYQRKWVTYEIEQSHQRKNGMIGVYIHDLKNENERVNFIGQDPFDHVQTKVLGRDTPLSRLYPTYSWKTDEGYKNLGSWIEQAARKAGR